jgi:hypothetical protein
MNFEDLITTPKHLWCGFAQGPSYVLDLYMLIKSFFMYYDLHMLQNFLYML